MLTKKDIIIDPNPILRKKAADVLLPLSQEDETLAKQMLKYVVDSQDEEIAEKYNLTPSVGIAAPQLGVSKKILCVYIEDDNGKYSTFLLANPKVIAESEQKIVIESGESCLSIPKDKEGYVPRHFLIKVRAWNILKKKEEVIKLRRFYAIVMQHEIDHLNGVLYYDRINKKDPFYKEDDWLEL